MCFQTLFRKNTLHASYNCVLWKPCSRWRRSVNTAWHVTNSNSKWKVLLIPIETAHKKQLLEVAKLNSESQTHRILWHKLPAQFQTFSLERKITHLHVFSPVDGKYPTSWACASHVSHIRLRVATGRGPLTPISGMGLWRTSSPLDPKSNLARYMLDSSPLQKLKTLPQFGECQLKREFAYEIFRKRKTALTKELTSSEINKIPTARESNKEKRLVKKLRAQSKAKRRDTPRRRVPHYIKKNDLRRQIRTDKCTPD